jgi:hypothetical protein
MRVPRTTAGQGLWTLCLTRLWMVKYTFSAHCEDPEQAARLLGGTIHRGPFWQTRIRCSLQGTLERRSAFSECRRASLSIIPTVACLTKL